MSDFLDLLVDFFVSNFPQHKGKEKELKYALAGHYQFGTLDFDFDTRGVVYLVRYNVTGEVAKVLEFCVREDARNKVSIRKTILKNWVKFPFCKRISFVREMKYPQKKEKEYSIERIMYGKH